MHAQLATCASADAVDRVTGDGHPAHRSMRCRAPDGVQDRPLLHSIHMIVPVRQAHRSGVHIYFNFWWLLSNLCMLVWGDSTDTHVASVWFHGHINRTRPSFWITNQLSDMLSTNTFASINWRRPLGRVSFCCVCARNQPFATLSARFSPFP